jgi:uncharacterized protein YndB with AHSA1/START domain
MDAPEYVYVTYIATSPEKAWKALTDPGATAMYWQHENRAECRPGSRWEHRRSDTSRALDLVGRVVECSPPRRLVLTWAFPGDEKREERHTRVAFDLEAFRDVVRLTVTHDHLEPGSEMQRGISDGWPKVLSSLKTLLEVGRPLPVLW